MTTIHQVLYTRDAATSKRDLGDKFERLVVAYLKSDPIYTSRFTDFWIWGNWTARDRITDTGIDLVAKEQDTDGYCAIQCKFYSSQTTLEDVWKVRER